MEWKYNFEFGEIVLVSRITLKPGHNGEIAGIFLNAASEIMLVALSCGMTFLHSTAME